jgi:hypothetical protein
MEAAVDSYVAGLELGRRRLDARWQAVAFSIALLVTLTGLLIEHRAAPSTSADATMLSVTFGIVIPLLVLVSIARAFPTRVDRALVPIARHGGDRRRALLGVMTPTLAFTVTAPLLLAVATRLLGGSVSNPAISDAFTCGWIGALAGLGYSCWYLLGSAFGERGQGRWIALIIDWALGIGTGALALPWPRAHLRNLLGGLPPTHLEQWHASAVLAALICVYGSVVVWRTPR